MQTPSRVNPATDQGKNPGRSNGNTAEDLSMSSPEELGAATNSALTRAPSDGLPTFGSDEEFTKERAHSERPQFAQKALEKVSKVGSQAQEIGKQAISRSGSVVRQHPVPTLLGCFGVGLIAGFFIGRR